MATRSTIFKARLQIADNDHGGYADHALTLAQRSMNLQATIQEGVLMLINSSLAPFIFLEITS